MVDSVEDGGAFAECFFAQYPLGMGKRALSSAVMSALNAKVETQPHISTDKLRNVEKVLTPSSATSSALVLHTHQPTFGHRTLTVKNGRPSDDMTEAAAASELARTTERTKEALNEAIKSRQPQEEDFSGRTICRTSSKRQQQLEIIIPGESGLAGANDPAPIVRSPTRSKKVPDIGDDKGHDSTALDATTAVPFSIGNWKNKRKLVIPLEQRLSQQADAHPSTNGGAMSDSLMTLAIAMQRAKREVEEEQSAREKARQAAEERQQAEREAEATRRAKELLERAAADSISSAPRRRETREERLERIRTERELREREKAHETRQRRLNKAAARLGMTLDALEADAELMHTVDAAAVSEGRATAIPPPNSGHSPTYTILRTKKTAGEAEGMGNASERPISAFHDEEEATGEGQQAAGARGGLRKGVFGSAVISNEGIRREMEALAKMEETGKHDPQRHGVSGETAPNDGIRMRGDSDASSEEDEDDEDGGLGMDQLMKKKKRRL